MDSITINITTLIAVITTYAHIYYKLGKLEGKVSVLCQERKSS